MCLLLLLRERVGYMSTPDPVSVVCVKERFGYLITPTHMSNIPVEGEVWLYKHS